MEGRTSVDKSRRALIYVNGVRTVVLVNAKQKNYYSFLRNMCTMIYLVGTCGEFGNGELRVLLEEGVLGATVTLFDTL